MYITKYVPGTVLQVGQEVKGYKQNESDIPMSFLGKVTSITDTSVTIIRFNTFESEYDINGLFKIQMSDTEIIDKYVDEVKATHTALHTQIPLSECGVYAAVVPFALSVVFNSIYGLVDCLEKEGIHIVGVCNIDDPDSSDNEEIYLCYAAIDNTRYYSKVQKSVVQAYLEDILK